MKHNLFHRKITRWTMTKTPSKLSITIVVLSSLLLLFVMHLYNYVSIRGIRRSLVPVMFSCYTCAISMSHVFPRNATIL